MKAHLGFAIGAACLAAACTTGQTPVAKAAAVEQLQCEPSSASDSVGVLQRTTVLSAGPLYSHVRTGKDDSEDRVTGAKLIVRAPEGVSAEKLTRLLQCHSAQVLLGQVDTSKFSNDPYSLPNAWVDIDVKGADGNYTIVLRADSVSEGLNVLHRATAFADAQRNSAQP